MKRVKIRFNNVGSCGKILRFDDDIRFDDLLRLIVKKLGLDYYDDDDDDDIRTTYRLMLGNDHVEVEDTDDIEDGDDLVLQQQVIVYDPDDDDDDNVHFHDYHPAPLVDNPGGFHPLQQHGIHQHPPPASGATVFGEESFHHHHHHQSVQQSRMTSVDSAKIDNDTNNSAPTSIGGGDVHHENTFTPSPTYYDDDVLIVAEDNSQQAQHLHGNSIDVRRGARDGRNDHQVLSDDQVEVQHSLDHSHHHHNVISYSDSNNIVTNAAILSSDSAGDEVVVPQRVVSGTHPGATGAATRLGLLRHDHHGVVSSNDKVGGGGGASSLSKATIASDSQAMLQNMNNNGYHYETLTNSSNSNLVNQTPLSHVGHSRYEREMVSKPDGTVASAPLSSRTENVRRRQLQHPEQNFVDLTPMNVSSSASTTASGTMTTGSHDRYRDREDCINNSSTSKRTISSTDVIKIKEEPTEDTCRVLVKIKREEEEDDPADNKNQHEQSERRVRMGESSNVPDSCCSNKELAFVADAQASGVVRASTNAIDNSDSSKGHFDEKIPNNQVAIKIEPMEEPTQEECLGQFSDAESDVTLSAADAQNYAPAGRGTSEYRPECYSASDPAEFGQVAEEIEEDAIGEAEVDDDNDERNNESENNDWIPGFFAQQRISELLQRLDSEDELDRAAPSGQKMDDPAIRNTASNEALTNTSSRKSIRKPIERGHYNVNIMSLVVEAAATSKSKASKASTFQIQAKRRFPGKSAQCFRVGIQWFKDPEDRKPKIHWPDPSFELWRSVDKPLSSFVCMTHGNRWFDTVHDAKLYACLSFLFKHPEQFGPSPALRRFFNIPDLPVEEGSSKNRKLDKDISSYGFFVMPKKEVFALGVRRPDGTTGYFLLDENRKRASDVHRCKSVGLAKRHGVKAKGMRPFRGIVNHFGPIHNLSTEYKGCSYNVLVRWANGNLSKEPLVSFAKYGWNVCYEYAKENRLLNVVGWKFLTKKRQRKKPVKRKRSSSNHGTHFGGRSSKQQRQSRGGEQSRGEGTAEKGSQLSSTKSRSR